jgi:hypothetical protein
VLQELTLKKVTPFHGGHRSDAPCVWLRFSGNWRLRQGKGGKMIANNSIDKIGVLFMDNCYAHYHVNLDFAAVDDQIQQHFLIAMQDRQVA